MSLEARVRELDAPCRPIGRRLAPDLAGRTLDGRYRISRCICVGGTTSIYEAEHAVFGGNVAVKVLDPRRTDAATQSRFMREARALSSLRSEHIVAVFDFGRGEDDLGREWVYIAMERLDGEDLATTLEQDGPLRWTRVLSIGKQVCEALAVAHASGVVHRDVKPGNCFRVARGDDVEFIKLLDFGVAGFASEETGQVEASGPVVIGTPGYMPEEQLRGGPHDHRVDIFALGVLMYRLLTNKMPYAGGSLFLPRRPASGPCPLGRAAPTIEIPAEFEAVILKAVAADPADRYGSARELLAALVDVEHALLPASRLARDPLCWGEQTAADVSVTEEAVRAEASDTDMSRVEVAPGASGRWRAPHVGAPPALWAVAAFFTSALVTAALRTLSR